MNPKLLFVASEIYPYVKTGGLADVAGALPGALADGGVDIRLLLPGYPDILRALEKKKRIGTLPDPFFGVSGARLLRGVLPGGLTAYALDIPAFYDRVGPYGDSQGQDWPDNPLRFGALCRVAADLPLFDPQWTPDIIHGHDWQCGLIPAYLDGRPDAPRTVTTIHNLAYQGLFPAQTLQALGLSPAQFNMQGVEFYGQIGFLKAGLYYSDALTTVSPTYAQEIQGEEQGCGLGGLLRERASRLHGILNGIDADIWNPATDRHIVARYDKTKLRAKAANRQALLEECGLTIPADQPVFGVVSRLVQQKGLDLLLESFAAIAARGAGLVVLGTGDSDLENGFAGLAAFWPGQISVRAFYDESLAHRIIAGVDSVIIPSRFEPCGLVQMYGLRYGALPLVRNTGGLADTVIDAGDGSAAHGTGFVFPTPDTKSLATALHRACNAFADPAQWKKIQIRAMDQDFSWPGAARRYIRLYETLTTDASRT